MALDMAHREVFPGAIYSAQDGNGEIVKYKSVELDIVQRRAILNPIDPQSTTFTIAESDLDIRMLEPLAEPKTVPLSIPGGQLQLTLGWGEITSSVTGYKLCVRQYELTCVNRSCGNYHRPLSGKSCQSCRQRLKNVELVTVIDSVAFEKPYLTQYRTPIVRVEVNEPTVSSIAATVGQLKEQIRTTYESIPTELSALWETTPLSIALHSIGHQIVLVVL